MASLMGTGDAGVAFHADAALRGLARNSGERKAGHKAVHAAFEQSTPRRQALP